MLVRENRTHAEFWAVLVEKACPGQGDATMEALGSPRARADVVAACKLPDTVELERPAAAATALRLAGIADWVASEMGQPDQAPRLLAALLHTHTGRLDVAARSHPAALRLPALDPLRASAEPAHLEYDVLITQEAVIVEREEVVPLSDGTLPPVGEELTLLGDLFDVLASLHDREAHLSSEARPLVIAVDRRVPWEVSARVLASAKKAEFEEVRLLVLVPDVEQPLRTVDMGSIEHSRVHSTGHAVASL